MSSSAPSPSPRSRPTPPGRSKRTSLGLGGSNSPLLTPSQKSNLGRVSSPLKRTNGEKGGGGMLGGLRERSEEELRRAGREELSLALKGEWEEKDRVSDSPGSNDSGGD